MRCLFSAPIASSENQDSSHIPTVNKHPPHTGINVHAEAAGMLAQQLAATSKISDLQYSYS